jgi:hypothetical protein
VIVMSYWAKLIDDLSTLSKEDLASLELERMEYGSGYRYKTAYIFTRFNDLFIHIYKNTNLSGESIEVYGDDWVYPEDELGNEIRDIQYQHRVNDWLIRGQWCAPINTLFENIKNKFDAIRKEKERLAEIEKAKEREKRREYLSDFEEGFK